MFYHGENGKSFTTIDIVKNNMFYRIPKKNKRLIKTNLKESPDVRLLRKLWSEYNKYNQVIAANGTLDIKSKHCPFIHCIWGFDKSEINKYSKTFKFIANKRFNELSSVIRYGKNDDVRAEAVFLIAHSDNARDTALLLVNFINDDSSHVRNNVMRVLGAILSKQKINALPLPLILKALNYPYVTDRNKAAYMLLNIVKRDKSTHKIILIKGGTTLIKLLKLRQPNNHDFAFHILKEISHENYSDKDIESWEAWVDKHS